MQALPAFDPSPISGFHNETIIKSIVYHGFAPPESCQTTRTAPAHAHQNIPKTSIPHFLANLSAASWELNVAALCHVVHVPLRPRYKSSVSECFRMRNLMVNPSRPMPPCFVPNGYAADVSDGRDGHQRRHDGQNGHV